MTDLPQRLASLGLRQPDTALDLATIRRGHHYVYALICPDDSVLYVGKTGNLITRTSMHTLSPRMASADWLLAWRCADDHHATRAETLLIHSLRPPENRHIPSLEVAAR